MAELLQKLLSWVLDKKKIIGWLSALAFLVGGLATKMSTQDFKDAVCGASVIQGPALNSPQAPAIAPLAPLAPKVQ